MYYLAYRLRLPVGAGRGYANVIARSADGVRYETLAVIGKDTFGAESLERPALTVTETGRWRLYVSCATPASYHWRVELLEAATPAELATATPRPVLPGGPALAVKDPVIARTRGRWHLWASCHPLHDPANTDRMSTAHATSADGIDWHWHGTALAGRPGAWDARGTRITAVLLDQPRPLALYDGRATAAENTEERTGIAIATSAFGRFTATGTGPAVTSPLPPRRPALPHRHQHPSRPPRVLRVDPPRRRPRPAHPPPPRRLPRSLNPPEPRPVPPVRGEPAGAAAACTPRWWLAMARSVLQGRSRSGDTGLDADHPRWWTGQEPIRRSMS